MGKESNFGFSVRFCFDCAVWFCFQTVKKKGGGRLPNNQPGAADRKAVPDNFPWEEFQKLP